MYTYIYKHIYERCQIDLENRNLTVYKCKLETFSYTDRGQHNNNAVFTQKRLAALVTFFYVRFVVYNGYF